MNFLATGIPGLETAAQAELRQLLGVASDLHHRGAVWFEADRIAPFEINEFARSIHRVVAVLETGTVETLSDSYRVATRIPVEEYFDPGQSFGVRADRHGSHDFTSVDIGERIGQAIVDGSREAFGTRLPVDLDNPDVIVRAYLRHDRLIVGIDATGERSLHRRAWRECEHNAPLRPTIAHAALRIAGYEPTESVLDPMCGGGTIPIEAARWARNAPAGGVRSSFAADRLTFLPADGRERARRRHERRTVDPDITGVDRKERWIRCARVNRSAADLDDAIDLRRGDATEIDLDADVIAVDLPFGIRTSDDLRGLYAAFCANLETGDWDRFVAVTTRPEFLTLPDTETIHFRYGRLDASLVLAER